MAQAIVKKGNRFIGFFQESYHELRKVNWPTRQQWYRLTMIVIGVSVATAVFLGILDLLFDYALQAIL